jgi:hypothetical protein
LPRNGNVSVWLLVYAGNKGGIAEETKALSSLEDERAFLYLSKEELWNKNRPTIFQPFMTPRQ